MKLILYVMGVILVAVIMVMELYKYNDDEWSYYIQRQRRRRRLIDKNHNYIKKEIKYTRREKEKSATN